MKNLFILAAILILVVLSFSIRVNAQIQSNIDKANKEGNVVFLVVTDGTDGVANATSIAEQAGKSYSKSKVITMDRNDKSNADFVSKYRLMGAPMPLILVVATNGIATGGAPASKVTAEELVQMIPTAKHAEIIKAFTKGKAALVVVGEKSFKDKTKAINECKIACSQLKDQAVYIFIDIADKSEKSFLKMLNIPDDLDKTTVIVFNSIGQGIISISDSYKAADLVQAANKRITSGCCSGGSSSGCAPKK
jgi:hypothetical protein